MTIESDTSQKLRTLFQGAQRILCITHANPDGDAIGSILGMGKLLRNALPAITVQLHCIDPSPDTFSFLPGSKSILGPPEPKQGDVIVSLDAAEPKLTHLHESHPTLFDGTYPCVCIDHHPTNSRFGSINIIHPQAASTCEIVVDIADALGWSINAEIATCLLTGVYTDTGGLLHSNTTEKVYRTVARLIHEGGRRQEIIEAVYRTSKLSTMRLWGRVLEKINLTDEGGAISAVTEADFRATNSHYSELTGAIDYVNAVPGMRFSLILSERDGKVKGSLRTLRDDVDVAAMAGKFSGGGHKKAAGFALPGKLKPEVRWKVVDEEK